MTLRSERGLRDWQTQPQGTSGTAAPEADAMREPLLLLDPEPASPSGPRALTRRRRRWTLAREQRLRLAVGLAIATGLVFFFWARSALWLDEALAVNIARLPLAELPDALRWDGSPPLYYAILHGWMQVFGTSTFAVRSLSGLFATAAIPVAWKAAHRLGGRTSAWTAALLMATSPFAIRFATEARMYALVVLLTLVGYVVLTGVLERPTPRRLVALAALTCLLLLTHYWVMYLLATVAIGLGARAVRGREPVAARKALAAMGAGCLLFLPWTPVFVYQLRHTGTPWASPAKFSALIGTVFNFAGGGSAAAQALGVLLFAVSGLALFGRAVDFRHIELDLVTRSPAQWLAAACAGTVALAVAAGLVVHVAFQQRYTATVFGLFILLLSIGVTTFADPKVRIGVVSAMVVLGLIAGSGNAVRQRTEAGRVAQALNAFARPGDVVAYCPDQLGPSTSRLLRTNLQQLTFPRALAPDRVNWIDYKATNESASPRSFAHMLQARAGRTHSIWLVWSPGYLTLSSKCQALETALADGRPSSFQIVEVNVNRFPEHAGLVWYP